MRSLQRIKVKSLLLSGCIITALLFSVIINISNINYGNINRIENIDEKIIYSLNGRDYLAKYITTADIDKMQKDLNEKPMSSKSNFNTIIENHGTGYALPSNKDLNALTGKLSLLEMLPEESYKYKASADLSTESYFPTVGDQGMQGSCSAWANAYYAYGYLEAKDYGWDASSGNPDYLLSPAWAYNIIAANDYGSVPYEVAQVLVDWGIPTLSAMPYDDMDVDSWGNENAWRQAPYHRPFNYTLITYTGTSTIDLIKGLISSGIPVTIGIDSYQFYYGLNEGTMDYILSSDEYDPSSSLNHAQCLVGYDDAITEGSDIGAFRVVNSWGSSWMNGGFYWLTYDAFMEFADAIGQVIMFISDRPDYSPDLIATWEFSSAPTRMGDIITLGAGSYSAPLETINPHYDYDTNNVFPSFMAFDISDFRPYYNLNNDEFFFLELGYSTDAGTISSFLIERYDGGMLSEITNESIDVPQTTPCYVRNTFMDFDHEIGVSLEFPEDPEIYESYVINATVHNYGINDESNVELYLYLDGSLANSTTFTTLLAGSSRNIDYLWKPMTYDTYNFTVYSPPKGGEYTLDNNFKSFLIAVKFLLNYSMTIGYPYSWIDASGGTELTLGDDDYAAVSLPFDFSFYDLTFSTIYLCSNGYLSFYDTMPGQFFNIPFPSGDLSHYYMMAPFWTDVDPTKGGHIYVQSFGDHWVAEWQNIYHYGLYLIGSFQVVLYESGEILFNYDYLDDASYYTCGLNFGADTRYYNYYQGLTASTNDLSILFKLEALEHDLKVSLDTPDSPELNTSYTVTASVRNYGKNIESNINFYLYYDSLLVNNTFISSLSIGESKSLIFNWTPANYKTYNITAYASPVVNESYISNNRVEKLIAIHPVKLFDGMYIDYMYSQMGMGGLFNLSYSQISSTEFHGDWEISYMGMEYQGFWDVDANTRIIRNVGGSLLFGAGSHTPFWIYPDSLNGDIIPIAVDGEVDHNFKITGDFLYDLPGFGLIDVWILEDLTFPGGIAWYEKSSGILLYGDFLYYNGMFEYEFDFEDTNIPFEYLIFDHDIQVYLDIPLNVKIDNSYLISATIKNKGLFDESDVDLFLYLDEILIDSITISSLTVGMEQTIQYMWTPTEYKAYNFTAIASVVPFESYLENNNETKIIYVTDTELFDGLYIKHIYRESVYSYNTQMTYSYYNGRLFYETWNIEYMGTLMVYSWIVDTLTRVMSEGSGFGDGFHTPMWIFTNISLFDTVPIAVDGEGDHNFYVVRDLVYDLPGFGPVEVWELEDLTQPGGLAWYEKSTGILLNGTFSYGGGYSNYTLDFVDTNAELKILTFPEDFVLISNAGDPDEDGSFQLTWTSIEGVTEYSVYRYSSYISEINESLTLVEYKTTELNLNLNGYIDGTYYFIVVAHEDTYDMFSNCIKVVVLIPEPITPGIPGYSLPYLMLSMLNIIILVIILKFKRISKVKS